MVTRLGPLGRTRHCVLRREPGRGVPGDVGLAGTQNASEATVQKIDSEIKRLVEGRLQRGETGSSPKKRADLEALAKGLLEFETLTRRGDHGSLEGQEAKSRVGARADDAARLRGCRRPASRGPAFPILTPGSSLNRQA